MTITIGRQSGLSVSRIAPGAVPLLLGKDNRAVRHQSLFPVVFGHFVTADGCEIAKYCLSAGFMNGQAAAKKARQSLPWSDRP